ncbi:MAG: hypothetical protein J0M20_15380, partial [Burkholderiales bacterium]|nr:hypothetical protein [Burkholderiales bacterium]
TLSARWVAVEPDNAAAWLQQAHAAHLQVDAAAETDAMHRASLAPRYQPPSAWMPALLDAQLPAELRGEPRLVLQIGASAAAVGLSTMAMAALDHCRQAAAEDPNRAQTCLRLAELMLAQAPDLVSLNFAEALGRHAGWPEERQAALRNEREALMSVQQRDPPAAVGANGQVTLSCLQILQGGATLQRMARMGELAALRAWRRGV